LIFLNYFLELKHEQTSIIDDNRELNHFRWKPFASSSSKSNSQSSKLLSRQCELTSQRFAIAQTIRTEFPNDNWNEIKKDITFKYTEFDLNNDGIKETLVSIQQGFPCNNRSCPVYIYQKNGSNYRCISDIFTSKGELQVAVLPNNNKGWINIAAPVFTYELREIAWRVFKFDGQKYQLTSQKLSSPPKSILLRESSGYKYTF
jgi:hypothetical protein